MLDNADLIASEGMIFTDGKEIFAKKIWLGEGMEKDAFFEIPIEVFEALLDSDEI